MKNFLSVLGMDNFGGMNNMDRFSSSGMGRMNGKDTIFGVLSKRGTLSRFAGHF